MHPVDHTPALESRRPPETPSLWLSLVAGSVLIHLILLILVGVSSLRTAKVQMATDPIAVEFVEPSAPTTRAGGTALTQSTTSKAAVAPQATVKSTVSPPRSIVQAPARPVAPPIATPPDASSFTAPPSPLPPRPRRSRPQRLQNTPPLGNPQPPPNARRLPPPLLPQSPVDTNANSGSEQEPSGQPNSGNSGDRTPAAGNPSGGRPLPSGGGPGEPALPGISVSERRGEGTGLKITVSNVALANEVLDHGRTDTVDQPAHLKAGSDTLPSVRYSAVVGLNLGQTIKLKMLVKSNGTVDNVQIVDSGAAQDYNDFAKGLVEGLVFEPSQTAGKPVDSYISFDLRIDPLR